MGVLFVYESAHPAAGSPEVPAQAAGASTHE
jgi:hypothetical protein